MAYIDSSVDKPRAEPKAPAEPEVPELTTEPEEEEVQEGELSVLDNLMAQLEEVNIASRLDEETLREIGELVVDEYEIDEDSRAEWVQTTKEALKFAKQQPEPKNYPFENSSNIIYPLITTAAIQFAARTYPSIIQNRQVCKGVVWGSDKGTPQMGADGQPIMDPKTQQPVWLEAPGEKRQRADRIGGHISYQLMEEMPEWESQVDIMLHMLPIVGGAAKKTYYDPAQTRNFSLLVPLLDLVWNRQAKSFESAPRHTEILTYYPHEIEEMVRSGLFLDLGDEFTAPDGEPNDKGAGDPDDSQSPVLFLEQHRLYDLDDDGYPEPYIVTVHKVSGKVVRMAARYDEDSISADIDTETGEATVTRIEPIQHYTLVPFLPDPEGGSYPVGWGHLLRPLNESINTTLNQMFDAGHLQNAGGGFIGTSLSLASGPTKFSVGKYIPVNNKGQAIRDAVFPLPFAGPSPVLFQLLGLLLQAGKEVSSTQDVLTGEASLSNQPPTTILALIEQGMKLYTAINKRVFRALKSEYDKLFRLNRKLLTEKKRFKVGDEWLEVSPDDYRLGGGVEPIADPSMVTDMQKLGRAAVLMQFMNDPLINQIELRKRFLDSAQIDRVEDLLITNPQLGPAEQMKMQEMQAQMERNKAGAMKDQTAALLNIAQIKSMASESEQRKLDAMADMVRNQIDATYASLEAKKIDQQDRKLDIEEKKITADTRKAELDVRKAELGVEAAAHKAKQAKEKPNGKSKSTS